MKPTKLTITICVFLMAFLVGGIALANDSGIFGSVSSGSSLAAPSLTVSTDGTTLSLSWTSVAGATGYTLLYAPAPYTGPDSIGSIPLGTQTSLAASLWNGAAFYVAIQAYNSSNSSDFSNIEYFIIDTFAVEYYVSIDSPESHYAHVKIQLENLGNWNQLTMGTHYWEETYLYYENVSIYGPGGNPLNYTHRKETSSLIWEFWDITIPSGTDSFTVEYDVHYLSTYNGNLNSLQAGILADRAIFDTQHCFFNFSTGAGAGQPFNPLTVDTKISFDIPSDWTVVSSWEGSGSTYQGTNEYIFRPTPTSGKYELSEFVLNGLSVKVAFPTAIKDKMQVSHMDAVNMAKNGITKMQDVYGNPSQSKKGLHDTVALIASYSPMASQESGNGTAYFNADHNDLENFQWSLAYGMGELLKLWLGDSEDTYWARKTMTYYELSLNLQLFGYRSSNWVDEQIKNWLSIYKEQIYGTRFDVSIPTVMDLLYYNNANKLSEEDRTYFTLTLEKKGSLFWFVIDEILKEKTNGQKSIYDFLGHMNRNFVGDYSVEDVISALSSIANWNFKQFFDDYYYGVKRLPVENYQ